MKKQLLFAVTCMIVSTHTMKAPGPYSIVNNTNVDILVASSAFPCLPGKNSYYTVKPHETYLLKTLISNQIKIKAFARGLEGYLPVRLNFNPKYNACELHISIPHGVAIPVFNLDQKNSDMKSLY